MLVALGHGGQLLIVEPKGEGFAILADEHIGTLDELGLGDGLQAADVGDGLLGQLLVDFPLRAVELNLLSVASLCESVPSGRALFCTFFCSSARKMRSAGVRI